MNASLGQGKVDKNSCLQFIKILVNDRPDSFPSGAPGEMD